MRDILATALAGTAQAGATTTPATGTEVDSLIAALPEGDAERRLLLAAGSASIYRAAGYVPDSLADAPAPTPDETLPACSPGAADLLRTLLSAGKNELLREALERTCLAGLRLPPDLLPAALDIRDDRVRAALFPAVGERGRWLAGFNKAWSWVSDHLPVAAGMLPADAETIWEEGTTGQRVEILWRVRAVDPERGRQWLQAVWKREKADAREQLLSALAIGLGSEDEPLLESALDDRAQAVRAEAADLLAKLLSSALVERMCARADAMLTYKDSKLDANPPKAVEKGAVRDGIAEQPPYGTGDRAWWLAQILSRVPPVHWVERFGLTPEELIAATRDASWQLSILEGWTHAAAIHQDRGYALPLWRFWSEPPESKKRGSKATDRADLLSELAPLVPSEEIEGRALAAIHDAITDGSIELDEVLSHLPRPWSRAVGHAYLDGLRAFVATLGKKSTSAEPWDDTLAAAFALPSECFAAALEQFTLPDDNTNWHIHNFRTQLEEFADTIRTRRRIVEEIPL
jgi:Family of unknown function (DUF5691)